MSNSYAIVGDDGWTEIVAGADLVGEQARGGSAPFNSLSPVLGDGYDVMGLVEQLQRSPSFNQYAAKRAAASRPVTHRQPLQRARDWDLSFGPVSGAAGTTTVITVAPQCLYRGEKMMATDTGSPVGTGTRVTQVLIGQRLQRPATGGGTLTLFFSQQALGNGIKWDTCQQALSISITVSFVQACTFDGTVFGKAVI
jgi:hypothetical protein